MRRALRPATPPLKAQLLSARDRAAALDFLGRDPTANLLLMELAAAVGGPASPSELAPQILVATRGGNIEGVASLRPSVALDAGMTPEVLATLMPYLESVESGLIKSAWRVVSPLWAQLSARGRGAVIDRAEIACAVRPEHARLVDAPRGVILRSATPADLEALVEAARASLREEDRPDPFDGDPQGFRRWVRGRLQRARVVEADGRVVFVGYADVRREEGWLIQGVYTWPAERRRGYAAVGMSGLIREAAAAGADHVQLAVIEGNTAAMRLYEGLGFQPFDRLRTLLFL